MNALIAFFGFIAHNGRIVLIAGLLIGIALPGLAQTLQPYIPEAAATMLFVTALRIGPRETIGRVQEMRTSLLIVLAYQIAIPCAFALIFRALGLSGPIANAVILVACAPPISGSPNLVLLTGNNPAPALRLLILGTALLPLSVFAPFLIWPAFGDPGATLVSALRLLALIGGATGLAFAIRATVLKSPSADTLRAIDGLSILVMALVVIGLMANFGDVLLTHPAMLGVMLMAAFAISFGLQIGVFMGFRRLIPTDRNAAAFAITAGNRNVMLFLAVLPTAVTAPLLLFVACYQIPMYLTPLLLGPLFRHRHSG